MATIGVLFKNALDVVMDRNIRARTEVSVFARPRNQRPSTASAPVSASAAVTTNNAAIVSMPWFEKPAKASSGLITPATHNKTAPAMNKASAA